MWLDGEPINQMVAQMMLENVGLIVDLVEDGRQAVEMARAAHFDLILLDMQMPHLDGLDAARQIRLLPDCAKVPILAFTGNAFAEDKARCIDAGMNDFITKPVEPEQLYTTLLNWFRSNQAA